MQLTLAPLRTSLANRRFASYLGAALLADTGFWIAVVAQGWLVERLTHAPVWLGLVAAASQAPALAVSLLGGLVADRFDRRAVILACNVVICGLAALTAALIGLDRIDVGLLLVLELALGTLLAVEHPVDRSFIYDLIQGGEVGEAVALSSAEFSLARTGGPAVGGIAIAVLGIAAGYGLYALCVLPVIVFALSSLRGGWGRKRERESDTEATLAEAWRYLRGERTILLFCALIAAFTVGVSPYVALLADVAQRGMGLDERGYGLLQAAAGFGALAGALALAAAGEPRRKAGPVVATVLTGGLLLAGFALTRTPLLAAPLLFAMGAVDALAYALANTYVQERVAPRYRGRANAVFTVAFLGGIPVGNVLLGALAQRIGSQPALFASGLCVAAFALLFAVGIRGTRTARA